MTLLALLTLLAGIIYFPPLFLLFFRFENYNTFTKYFLHLLKSLGFIGVGLFLKDNPDWIDSHSVLKALLIFSLAMFYMELTARLAIRVMAVLYRQTHPDFIYKWIDLSCFGDPLETRIVGHPFLQFTGRIGKPAGFQRRGAYGDYGFVDVSHKDLQKPAGIIRVACLGGSTTEYGYPALLEETLNSSSKKFQVLNFGLSWWTSIHTLVNYVLNVRDFKPDVVIIHDNVNDHKYRGYGKMRGDGAHAFVTWKYKGSAFRYLIHFSVIFRYIRLRTNIINNIMGVIGEFPNEGDRFSRILQRSGKTFNYNKEELELFRRNVETLINLAKIEKSKVILLTMPYSRDGSGETFEAIQGHVIETNELIREIAKDNGVALVDLARVIVDEDLFADLVHMTAKGDLIKATEIANQVRTSLYNQV